MSGMPTFRDTINCQNPTCDQKIVLPHSSLLRRVPNLVEPAKDDDYIDLACPKCAHVFRYTHESIQHVLFDTEDPTILPWAMQWFGAWLECDDESCFSHVLIESAVAKDASVSDLKAFVARWILHGITCYSGHPAKTPIELRWDSISAAQEKTSI